jgi:hypothetical protein
VDKNKVTPVLIIISLLLFLSVFATACLPHLFNLLPARQTPTNPSICLRLPKGIDESSLVGTWIGKHFGATDELIIRADGTYKQIYSEGTMKFESDWQKWWLEYAVDDTIRLHLSGMRRCDDTDSTCNNPGGGLPAGVVAINPCTPEYITYSKEVILFVSGYSKNVPRGIVLWQAKIAGSDWNFAYQLQGK